MSVAVSCNLSDGVILGVDSAVTVPAGGGGVAKVYEHAEKLLQIRDKPIGVATYGMATIRERTIGSYVREFDVTNPNDVLDQAENLADIVEALRAFFWGRYQEMIIPEVERVRKIKFDELPDEQKPALGFVIGGFLPGAYLSEVWKVVLPEMSTVGSAQQRRGQGSFGSDWFSIFEPIRRYTKGYDASLLRELIAYFENLRGNPLTPQERASIDNICGGHEYKIPFGAMPIEEGIAYVKFLVELVINHFRYSIGAPVVGGEAHVGLATYKEGKFRILGEQNRG